MLTSRKPNSSVNGLRKQETDQLKLKQLLLEYRRQMRSMIICGISVTRSQKSTTVRRRPCQKAPPQLWKPRRKCILVRQKKLLMILIICFLMDTDQTSYKHNMTTSQIQKSVIQIKLMKLMRLRLGIIDFRPILTMLLILLCAIDQKLFKKRQIFVERTIH